MIDDRLARRKFYYQILIPWLAHKGWLVQYLESIADAAEWNFYSDWRLFMNLDDFFQFNWNGGPARVTRVVEWRDGITQYALSWRDVMIQFNTSPAMRRARRVPIANLRNQ